MSVIEAMLPVPLRSACRRYASFALALLLWLFAAGATAQDLQPVPPLKERVTDLAGLLGPADRSALEDRLKAIEDSTGSQVAILTVRTTQPEPIEAYAIRVADSWKLGRKDIDDGALILVAADDRRMRIEVGRGLEGAIPDAIAKRIIAERMGPAFKQGDFAGGLTAAVESIAGLIKGEALPPPSVQSRRGNSGLGLEELFVVGMVASIFLGTILKSMFGRMLGSTFTAGLVGTAAWLVTGTIFVALIAGVLSLIFILTMGGGGGVGPGSRGRGGPWIGGGGGSMGGGSGGWSGGGGGFGGGGASGGW